MKRCRKERCPLEVPRTAAVLDFGVLRKAGTGPSKVPSTRGTNKARSAASKDVDGCILRRAGKPKRKFRIITSEQAKPKEAKAKAPPLSCQASDRSCGWGTYSR